MMNNVLRPGTIVCACYGDFDCNKRVGIFCVLYDEQLDGMLNNNNVTAIKITTSMRGAIYICAGIMAVRCADIISTTWYTAKTSSIIAKSFTNTFSK